MHTFKSTTPININTSSQQFVLNQPILSIPNKQAREKVQTVLNVSKPEHLPDIYFVKRNK